MLKLLLERWRQGRRTLAFPPREPALPPRFRGRPEPDPGAPPADLGLSLFAPEEPVAFGPGYAMASRTRDGLRADELALATALDERSRRVFGRSLRLRSVSAGSCNGCEAELVATGNVVFDLARFGVQFVASPRHADAVVVTGAVSLNMRLALEKTIDAMPSPKWVIAVGACAISGGPFRGSPEVLDGVPPGIAVDLYVPGCPPHPLTIVDGLLRLLGRIDGGVSPAAPPRG